MPDNDDLLDRIVSRNRKVAVPTKLPVDITSEDVAAALSGSIKKKAPIVDSAPGVPSSGSGSVSSPVSQAINPIANPLQGLNQPTQANPAPFVTQQSKQADLNQQQAQIDRVNKPLQEMYKHMDPVAKANMDKAMDAYKPSTDGIRAETPEETDHINFMNSPLGKIAGGVAYVGSKATKGTLQVAKGAAHLLNIGFNATNPAQQMITGDALDSGFDKADKAANFGLTKTDQDTYDSNKPMSAIGMAAEFAPAVAGGEALNAPKALMYLQGVGQGKEVADNMEKGGAKLNPLAKETLIQGSGLVNLLLTDVFKGSGVTQAIQDKVITGIAADALKDSAGKDLTTTSFKTLLENKTQEFAQKLQRAPVEAMGHFNETAKTFTKLNLGNYVLHKGVDAVNDKPVFNDTVGGLAEQEQKSLTQDAPIFAAVPALKEASKLLPNSGYRNDVIDAVMKNPSAENVDAIKGKLYDHGFDQNNPNKWTEQEMHDTFNHVDKIAAAARSLPSDINPDKQDKAVGLVLDRNTLTEKLKAIQEDKKQLDPSIQDIPTQQETFLTNKIDQANDKLRDIVAKTKTSYSKGVGDEDGKFFKTINGKKEEITPERHALETVERDAHASLPASDVPQPIVDKATPEQISKLPTPEEHAANNAETDKKVADFQAKFPDNKIDPLSDLPDHVVRTFDRIDNDVPTDPTAVKEASDWLYNKYKELSVMKKADTRLLTTDQIDSYQKQLGEDISLLEEHAKKYNPDYEKPNEEIKPEEQAATGPDSSTEVEVKPISPKENDISEPSNSRSIKVGDDYKLADETGKVIRVKELPTGETELKVKKADDTSETVIVPKDEESTDKEVANPPAEKPEPDATNQKETVNESADEKRTIAPEQSKAGDPLRSFADKIREGKINKLGGFKMSTGFDSVWDLSLEVVAKSIEGGAKIVDAVQDGLNHIKKSDWYKALDNKSDFEEKYKLHLQNEFVKDSPGYYNETGKAHVLTDKELSNKEAELTGKSMRPEQSELSAVLDEKGQRLKNKLLTSDLSDAKDIIAQIEENGRKAIPSKQLEAIKLIVDKYEKADNISQNRLEGDFKDAILTLAKTASSYTNTLELREAVKELVKRGSTKEQLIDIAQKEFKKYNYDEAKANEKIKSILEPVLDKTYVPNLSRSLRNFANKVREGKINKLGGFRASTGFDAIWDSSLEVVAKTLDGGALLADAIDAGLKHIRKSDWYGKLTEKDKFEKDYTEHLNDQYGVVEKEMRETSIKNATVTEERQERGLPEVERLAKRSFPEVYEKAKQSILNNEVDPRSLAEYVSKHPRSLTPEETVVLALDRMKLSNEHIENVDRLKKAYEDGDMDSVGALEYRISQIEKQTEYNDEASTRAGYEQGLGLAVRRLIIKEDYTYLNKINEAKVANDGKEISADVREKIKDLTSKLQESIKRQEELESMVNKLDAEKAIKRQAGTVKPRESKSRTSLKEDLNSILLDFRKDLKEARKSSTLRSDIPYRQELFAASKFILRVTGRLVEEGVHDIGEIAKHVKDLFKEDIDGITERDVLDVIAGKYTDKKKTKSELSQQISEIKKQSDLIGKIQDAENGDRQRSKGKEPVASAKTLELRKKLKDITKEEISAEQAKSNALKRQKELQKMIDDGDYEKQVVTKPVYDTETKKIKDQNEKLKRLIDGEIFKLRQQNRNGLEKSLDYVNAYRRAAILSRVSTLFKLGAAATERLITTPLEEGIGSAIRKIPGLSKIAENAPREGGAISLKAESAAFSDTFSKNILKDIAETIKHGHGSLDYAHGKRVPIQAGGFEGIMEFPGKLHAAIKVIPKRNEFYRSFEKRVLFAKKQGLDVNNPLVIESIQAEAYKDAQRSIFMNDNLLTTKYREVISSLENSKNPNTKNRDRIAAGIMKYVLPIVKVPTNFALETTNYAAGTLRALPHIIKAATKGADSLTPEQSDFVLRALKKNSIGLAMLAIGYYNPNAIGGYYQQGETRKEGDADVGDVNVFGVHLPHFLLHAPALEVLQIGATLRRVKDKYEKKHHGSSGVWQGTRAAAGGIASDVPFFDAPQRIGDALKSEKAAEYYLGEQAKSLVVPGIVQETAELGDKKTKEPFSDDPFGYILAKPQKRKMDGVVDHIQSGVPGLRNMLPKKK